MFQLGQNVESLINNQRDTRLHMFHDTHRFVLSNSFSCLDHLNGSSGIGGRLVISRLLVSTYLTARGPCNVSDWSNEEKNNQSETTSWVWNISAYDFFGILLDSMAIRFWGSPQLIKLISNKWARRMVPEWVVEPNRKLNRLSSSENTRNDLTPEVEL